jgi:hypothetical protein
MGGVGAQVDYHLMDLSRVAMTADGLFSRCLMLMVDGKARTRLRLPAIEQPRGLEFMLRFAAERQNLLD